MSSALWRLFLCKSELERLYTAEQEASPVAMRQWRCKWVTSEVVQSSDFCAKVLQRVFSVTWKNFLNPTAQITHFSQLKLDNHIACALDIKLVHHDYVARAVFIKDEDSIPITGCLKNKSCTGRCYVACSTVLHPVQVRQYSCINGGNRLYLQIYRSPVHNVKFRSPSCLLYDLQRFASADGPPILTF